MANSGRRCLFHPHREGKWWCPKYQVAYCDECCGCSHPEAYCKFRPECPIWQICLEGEPRHAGQASSDRAAQKVERGG